MKNQKERKPKTVNVATRIPEHQRDRLDRIVSRAGATIVNRNQAINIAVAEFTEKHLGPVK